VYGGGDGEKAEEDGSTRITYARASSDRQQEEEEETAEDIHSAPERELQGPVPLLDPSVCGAVAQAAVKQRDELRHRRPERVDKTCRTLVVVQSFQRVDSASREQQLAGHLLAAVATCHAASPRRM
jgi:hypothetical protein